MAPRTPPRQATRRRPRIFLVAVVVVLAAITAAAGSQLLASSSSATASPVPVLARELPGAPGAPGAPPGGILRTAEGGALGEADGAVPDGTTVFDDDVPGVVQLDPALLGALRRAATAAAHDEVRFLVDSGWRSRAYQERLLQEAVASYGSAEEAARWVATPDTSAHVAGDAVDLGPTDATAWLSEHGATYGLCPIYRNEPWHYELRPDALRHGCPPTYADATRDPRMQP